MSMLAAFGSGGVTFGNVSKNRPEVTPPVSTMGHRSPTTVAINNARNTVVFGKNRNQMFVYNVSDWSLVTSFTLAITVERCRFSPDDSLMVVTSQNSPGIKVFRTDTWEEVVTGIAARSYRYDVAFNTDGSRMALVENDHPRFTEFDTTTWAATQIGLPGISDSCTCACYLSGNRLAIGYWLSLRVFDTTTWTQIQSVSVRANGMVLTPDGKLVVGALSGATPRLSVYDTEDMSLLYSTNGVGDQPAALDAHPYEKRVLVGPNSGSVPVEIDTETGAVTVPRYAPNIPRNEFGGETIYGVAYIPAGPPRRVTGNVRDVNGDLVQRRIRAYDRADGALCAETLSDPTTGDYELLLYEGDVDYDIQFMAADGELLNDLFYARVESGPT